MSKILVTGAGGFIGHHLMTRLQMFGHDVTGVDIVPFEHGSKPYELVLADLRDPDLARMSVAGVDEVYHLAADMGGIGYITQHLASICLNNTRINLNILEACRWAPKPPRLLFSSTACVYPHGKQLSPDAPPLKEVDAWPAEPEPGYGLEKLYMEELCRYYRKDHHVPTSIVRFHNVFGAPGTYKGGKEKAPAAACRKVAEAPDGGEVEVWGDGQATRTFMHVNDCVDGLMRLMASGYSEPLNLGRDELVTVDQLHNMVAEVAGKRITLKHDLTKPQGVRGRNSDNSLLRQVLGWEPQIDLMDGLHRTYPWIEQQVRASA